MPPDYLISNQTYDFLKRFVTIFLPGFGALYALVTAIWHVRYPVAVLGGLAVLTLLGGLLMAFSDRIWDKSTDKYDGVLSVIGNDPDTGIPSISLNITKDPNSLVERDTLIFKSVDARIKD